MLRTSALLIAGALFAPSLLAQAPCFDLNIGTDLQMFDDDMRTGLALGFTFTYNGAGYTSVCLDSNGSIYLGATTTAFPDYTVDVNSFLSSPQPRICGLWTDFNCTEPNSGQIYFNAIPAGGGNPAYALFTWAGVMEYGMTTPIDVQVRLDANNIVTVTYGASAPVGGLTNTQVLVGATPGLGASPNPVSFATRPLVITQNNFHNVIAAPGPSGFKMQWTPTLPGYVVTDVTCTPNSFPHPASSTPVGVGCPTGNTMYELFDFSATVDLANSDLTILPNGGSAYLIIPAIAGPFSAAASLTIPAGDDTTHLVNLPFTFPHHLGSVTQIYVSSNGFLTLGNVDPFSGCCSGDPFALTSGPPRLAGWWSDLNPGQGGSVTAGLDSGSGEFVVTWNNVPEYFNTGSNTFQLALDPTGTMKIRYGAISNVGGHTFLTGYSSGNGTFDPGSTDLSALTVGEIAASTAQPLLQSATFGSRPQIGGTFSIDANNISPAPNGNIVMMIVNFGEYTPPIPLSAIGAPTCNLHVLLNGNEMQFLNFALGAPTITINTPIPLLPFLQGLTVVSQLASDDPTANAFGFKISNGLRWHLSTL